MPKRLIPLINDHIYHVYNRGTNGNTIFFSQRDYKRYLGTLWYYQFQNLTLNYSRFNKQLLLQDRAIPKDNLLRTDNRLVKVIAYCLMPNHFHLLVKQTASGGISKYLGDSQNSYTRYLNLKSNIQGCLFTSRFKNALIESDAQLIHVLRYILLNPYSAELIKTRSAVFSYPYSSAHEYYSTTQGIPITYPGIINSLFKNKSAFKKFVINNADYQRQLKRIEHLTLELKKPKV